MLFSNRVNSWSKDRKERTKFDTITMGSNENSNVPAVYMFRLAYVLSDDP